jgi:NAD(P)-dependent dehydrogenase (short-subunit alcohol dehydrogenase family)
LARNLFKDIGNFIAIRENSMSSTRKPVAIVTGASSGIGLGTTLALIEHGYNVVGTSRTISKSKELTASADLVLIDGDISKKETAVKVAEAAIEHFGRIDLLVNNAGIFLPKPFTEYTEDDYNLPDVEGQRSAGALPCRQSALSHRFGE